LIAILDMMAIATALYAAWLWYLASRHKLRRVKHNEVLDAHDINRMIVSINRTQILNSRAALATAVSAVTVALRFLASFLTTAFQAQ
jgi:hypothetical protein